MEEEYLKDKILLCVECEEEFVFTVGAQEYFLERGITEDPKRCKSCYMKLKKERRQQQKDSRRGSGYARQANHSNSVYRNSNYRAYKK